jgi:hypothetical protein
MPWACIVPSTTVPRRPPRASSTASLAACAAASVARASGSSARPESVSLTLRGPLPSAALADEMLARAWELGYAHRDLAALHEVLAATSVA